MINAPFSEFSPAVTLALLAFTLVFLFVKGYNAYRSSSRPFPPGPRGLPFIGAALSMPKEKEWLTYTEWGRKYGPIVGVNVLGQKIVILNSPEMAIGLMESRGALYSDRPSFTMLELMGYGDWNIGLMRYGGKLRLSRKILLQAMTSTAVTKYGHIQQREIYLLLRNLVGSQNEFSKHLRRAVGGIIMMVFYGHQVKSDWDEYIAVNDEAIVNSSRAGSPAAYFVNTFPTLRHLPAWFPGAGFQREAREGRILADKVFSLPMELVERRMANGTVIPCFVSSLLDQNKDAEYINAGKSAAATSYAAGVETTTSTLTTFILAMALNPAAQRRAQAEIDEAIGTDRLPKIEDRAKLQLPFIEALTKELFRWNPSGPLGLPHRLIQDDMVQGYFLPKGTIVLGNIWAMLHDDRIYPRPFEFLPERFLDGDLEDPRVHSFGYGRRVCPGRHLAEATLWLGIVCILAVLDISPDVDEEGKEVPIFVEYSSGVMSRPKDFKCRIKARSPAAMELVRRSAEEVE